MGRTTDLDRARRRYTRRKTAGRLMMVLLASAAAAVVYALRFDIASQGIGVWLSDAVALAIDNTGYPLPLESAPSQLLAVGRRAAVVTDQALSVFNAAGNQVVFERTAGKNVIAASAGKFLLLFARGGYDLSVRSGNTVLFQTRLDYPIYTAAISRSGAVAVAFAAQGDQAQVVVFDADYERQFVWMSSERLITALALDESGERLAVGGVRSDGGMLSSNLSLFAPATGEERFSVELADELLLSLSLPDAGTAVAVTDRTVRCFAASGGEQGGYSMNGEPLSAFAIAPDGGVALALGDFSSSHQTRLVLLDASARETASLSLERRVQSLHSYGDGVIAFVGDRAIRYTGSLARAAATETPEALRAAVVGDDLYYATMQQLFRSAIR
jgi:hypothetical protein